MSDKFGSEHGASGKPVPAMRGMDNFYIVDGRMIFYFMGPRSRVDPFTKDWQLARLFAQPVNPFF